MYSSTFTHPCVLKPHFCPNFTRRCLSDLHHGNRSWGLPHTVSDVSTAKLQRHVLTQHLQARMLVRYSSRRSRADRNRSNPVSASSLSDKPLDDALKHAPRGLMTAFNVHIQRGGGDLPSMHFKPGKASMLTDAPAVKTTSVSQRRMRKTDSTQHQTVPPSPLPTNPFPTAYARRSDDDVTVSAATHAVQFITAKGSTEVIKQKFESFCPKIRKLKGIVNKLKPIALKARMSVCMGSNTNLVWADCLDFAYFVKASQRRTKGGWGHRRIVVAEGLEGEGVVQLIVQIGTGAYYLGTYNCGVPEGVSPEEFKGLPTNVQLTIVNRTCDKCAKDKTVKEQILRLYETGEVYATKIPLRRTGYSDAFEKMLALVGGDFPERVHPATGETPSKG